MWENLPVHYKHNTYKPLNKIKQMIFGTNGAKEITTGTTVTLSSSFYASYQILFREIKFPRTFYRLTLDLQSALFM